MTDATDMLIIETLLVMALLVLTGAGIAAVVYCLYDPYLRKPFAIAVAGMVAFVGISMYIAKFGQFMGWLAK